MRNIIKSNIFLLLASVILGCKETPINEKLDKDNQGPDRMNAIIMESKEQTDPPSGINLDTLEKKRDNLKIDIDSTIPYPLDTLGQRSKPF